MALYRFQTSIQGKTGLSKDRYVTTMYFSGPEAAGITQIAPIETAIVNFWTLPIAGGSNTARYMSPAVNGELAHIKSYNMADSLPRVPINDAVFGMSPSTAPADGMPAEVAVCLSFDSQQVGVAPARRRGRIFIGPLASTVTTYVEATTASVRPATVFRQHLVDVAVRMAAAVAAADGGIWRWCVHSPTSGPLTAFVIDRAWVDDAFDTQRSRGVAPTSKISSAIPIP